ASVKPAEGPVDPSNTQFAALALWAGRRYGMPTQAALLRVDAYFRATQNRDGGWSYFPAPPAAGPVPGAPPTLATPGMGSTASMTCAGILGLALGHGGVVDLLAAKDGKVRPRDITKDARLMAGLQALGTAIGHPTSAWKGPGAKPSVARIDGKGYYYLW